MWCVFFKPTNSSLPDATINGVVNLKRHSSRDDLHFQITGGPFLWKKLLDNVVRQADWLRLQKVAGQIDWVGKTLALKNLHGDFRIGRANGEARFDFSPEIGTDYLFKVNLVDTDLREVLAFGAASTNRIEGRLNAELNISSANTERPRSCQGFGWVTVHDGLLWDLPMFGLFSPVLNTFIPGLGNSRARKANATFLITNSVISTSDLQVHATAMRMQFQGTVNFESRVEVRVEAELLRNMPGVGLVLSKVLWPVTKLFEYKVTGQLNNPKAQPVYVLPKILMAPFHPIKSIKELFGEPSTSAPK